MTITVLMYKVGESPKLVRVDNGLEPMQALVNGNLEAYHLFDNVTVICNEEGKLLGLTPNRVCNARGQELLVGDFFVTAGDEEGEFCDMTPTQIDLVLSLFEGCGVMV